MSFIGRVSFNYTELIKVVEHFLRINLKTDGQTLSHDSALILHILHKHNTKSECLKK
jgi:hypothetical protein